MIHAFSIRDSLTCFTKRELVNFVGIERCFCRVLWAGTLVVCRSVKLCIIMYVTFQWLPWCGDGRIIYTAGSCERVLRLVATLFYWGLLGITPLFRAICGSAPANLSEHFACQFCRYISWRWFFPEILTCVSWTFTSVYLMRECITLLLYYYRGGGGIMWHLSMICLVLNPVFCTWTIAGTRSSDVSFVCDWCAIVQPAKLCWRTTVAC